MSPQGSKIELAEGQRTTPPRGVPDGIYRELGYAGATNFWNQPSQALSQEYLPQLREQRGIQQYREMSLNEPVLGTLLFLIEMLLRSRTRKIIPADDSNAAREQADFITGALEDMTHPFEHVVTDFCTMFAYGVAWLEMIFKISNGDSRDPMQRSRFNDGKHRWYKIAGRSATCIERFENWPGTDDLKSCVFTFPDRSEEQEILLEGKSIHCRPSAAFNDPWGLSILRRAFNPYWYKKKYEEFLSVGIERDLAGYPKLTPPEGYDLWNDEDPDMVRQRQAALAFLRGVRRNAVEGALVPSGWEFELLRGAGDRQIDIEQTITRLEHRMGAVAFGDFIIMGGEQQGSKAVASQEMELFGTVVDAFGSQFATTMHHQAFRPLLRYNKVNLMLTPRMELSSVKEADLGPYAAFINALANAKIPLGNHPEILDPALKRFGLGPFKDNPADAKMSQQLAASAGTPDAKPVQQT